MGATVSRIEIEKQGGLQYKRILVPRRLSIGINPLDSMIALCIHGDAETGQPAYHDSYFPFTQIWKVSSQSMYLVQFSSRTLKLYRADNGDILIEVFSTDGSAHVLLKGANDFQPIGLSSTRDIDSIANLWLPPGGSNHQ
jgi:hypothetical protein